VGKLNHWKASNIRDRWSISYEPLVSRKIVIKNF